MNTGRRHLDWVMVLLVGVVVLSPAISIIASNWTDGLEVLLWAALAGMAASALISISRFRSLTAHLLSLVYGAALIGHMMTSALAFLSLRERILNLYFRVSGWILVAVRGGTGRDSMMFILLLALLFWWIGYLAIWNTVRQQRIWRALIPPGVALVINYYYYAGSSPLAPYLVLYLLCAFLVIVRSYTVLQERRWTSEQIGFNSEVRFDLLRSGLVLGVLAITLAWVVPTAATSEQAYEMWRRVEGPWRRVEEDFTRMFSTLRSQARVYGNPFGRMITLRGPRTLRDTPVLQVIAPSEHRYYWWGIAYDRYTGSGWINTDTESVRLDNPWQSPNLEYYSAREIVTQTVMLFLPRNTLVFAAPQPVRVSVPVQAEGHINRSGNLDISQLTSIRTMMQGALYQVVSLVSFADTASLRNAGTDYPAWVTERYLQLPESLPPSVRQQARTIAGDLATPYDKAAAIEAWLRANVVYDDKTPAPPEDQDGVQYVLTIKRGYCDYYASAMVVMLRALNVPARLVVGYAQGRYDSANNVYHVTEKDSHTWVEVFFPKYGWIVFEPTASQPEVIRPTPQPVTPTPTPGSGSDDEDSINPGGIRSPREPDLDELERGFGAGFRRTSLFGGLFDSWIGPIALAGLILALVFVFVWLRERRALGRARRPRSAARGFGSWLGLIGLVELAVIVLFLALYGLGRVGVGALGNLAAVMAPWIAVIGLAEILAALALTAMGIFERYGLRGMTRTAQVYARLLRFSNWLNVRWKDSQTPRERGQVLARAAPDADEFITQIVDNYTREQYSPVPPDPSNAEQLWQATSPLLWMAGLRQRIRQVRGRVDDLRLQWDALVRRLNQQFG